MLRHQRNMKRIRKDCMKSMVAESLQHKFGDSAVHVKEDAWHDDDDMQHAGARSLHLAKQSHSANSYAKKDSCVSWCGLGGGAGETKGVSEKDDLN